MNFGENSYSILSSTHNYYSLNLFFTIFGITFHISLVAGEREEDLLMYKNAHADLEILIQSVLSSFAFTLENAALEEYQSETSYIPPETTRLVRT